MKKVLVMSIIGLLVMSGVYMAVAATQQAVTASVTVTGAASITVDSSTLTFGPMIEGATTTPVEDPLVITIDSNAGYTVKTKADQANFNGPGTLAASNLEWDDAGTGPWTDYTIGDVTVATGSSPGTTHNLYHQLTIPVDTPAGSYNLPITLSVTTP